MASQCALLFLVLVLVEHTSTAGAARLLSHCNASVAQGPSVVLANASQFDVWSDEDGAGPSPYEPAKAIECTWEVFCPSGTVAHVTGSGSVEYNYDGVTVQSATVAIGRSGDFTVDEVMGTEVYIFFWTNNNVGQYRGFSLLVDCIPAACPIPLPEAVRVDPVSGAVEFIMDFPRNEMSFQTCAFRFPERFPDDIGAAMLQSTVAPEIAVARRYSLGIRTPKNDALGADSVLYFRAAAFDPASPSRERYLPDSLVGAGGVAQIIVPMNVSGRVLFRFVVAAVFEVNCSGSSPRIALTARTGFVVSDLDGEDVAASYPSNLKASSQCDAVVVCPVGAPLVTVTDFSVKMELGYDFLSIFSRSSAGMSFASATLGHLGSDVNFTSPMFLRITLNPGTPTNQHGGFRVGYKCLPAPCIVNGIDRADQFMQLNPFLPLQKFALRKRLASPRDALSLVSPQYFAPFEVAPLDSAQICFFNTTVGQFATMFEHEAHVSTTTALVSTTKPQGVVAHYNNSEDLLCSTRRCLFTSRPTFSPLLLVVLVPPQRTSSHINISFFLSPLGKQYPKLTQSPLCGGLSDRDGPATASIFDGYAVEPNIPSHTVVCPSGHVIFSGDGKTETNFDAVDATGWLTEFGRMGTFSFTPRAEPSPFINVRQIKNMGRNDDRDGYDILVNCLHPYVPLFAEVQLTLFGSNTNGWSRFPAAWAFEPDFVPIVLRMPLAKLLGVSDTRPPQALRLRTWPDVVSVGVVEIDVDSWSALGCGAVYMNVTASPGLTNGAFGVYPRVDSQQLLGFMRLGDWIHVGSGAADPATVITFHSLCVYLAPNNTGQRNISIEAYEGIVASDWDGAGPTTHAPVGGSGVVTFTITCPAPLTKLQVEGEGQLVSGQSASGSGVGPFQYPDFTFARTRNLPSPLQIHFDSGNRTSEGFHFTFKCYETSIADDNIRDQRFVHFDNLTAGRDKIVVPKQQYLFDLEADAVPQATRTNTPSTTTTTDRSTSPSASSSRSLLKARLPSRTSTLSERRFSPMTTLLSTTAPPTAAPPPASTPSTLTLSPRDDGGGSNSTAVPPQATVNNGTTMPSRHGDAEPQRRTVALQFVMPQSAAAAVAATSGSSVAVSSLLSPSTGARSSRIGSVGAIAQCKYKSTAVEAPSPWVFPVAYPVGGDNSTVGEGGDDADAVARFAGALLGNVAIVALPLVMLAVIRRQRTARKGLLKVCRTVTVAALAYFGPPVAGAATTLLTAHGGTAHVMIGAFGLGMTVAAVAYLAWVLLGNFGAKEVRGPKGTIASYRDIEKGSGFVATYLDFFDGIRAATDAPFCRALLLVEYGTAGLLEAAAGLRLGGGWCVPVALVALAVGVAYSVYLIAVRPYEAKLEQALAIASATVQLLLAFTAVVAQFNFSSDVEFTLGALSLAAALSFYINVIVLAGWRYFLQQRRQHRGDAAKSSDDDDDGSSSSGSTATTSTPPSSVATNGATVTLRAADDSERAGALSVPLLVNPLRHPPPPPPPPKKSEEQQ